MALFCGRSEWIKHVTIAMTLSLASALSFAQRPVQVAPPPMRVAPAMPPAYRAPVYQPPSYAAPRYAPIYGSRISAVANPLTTIIARPPFRPIRPLPPAFRFYVFPVAAPVYPTNFCWWATCSGFWTSALVYNGLPLDNWNPANSISSPVPEGPLYVFGAERSDIPQLFLKDGTVLFVNDYWVVDEQLHFTIVEDEGMKPAEHVVQFDELDLQKTIDVNTQRGFRFMLRNEPFELYIRDHPEGAPASLSPR